MVAHSGAKIGIRDSYTVTMPSREVPCFFPTILQQLQEFNGDPANVKWVLMNGGINDVEVQRVFNPMIPQYELELHTRNYCGRDLLAILQQVTQKFPNALAWFWDITRAKPPEPSGGSGKHVFAGPRGQVCAAFRCWSLPK